MTDTGERLIGAAKEMRAATNPWVYKNDETGLVRVFYYPPRRGKWTKVKPIKRLALPALEPSESGADSQNPK